MLLSSFIQESTAALGRLYPAPEARSMVLMLCEELITHRLNFRHPDLLLLKSIPLKSRVIEDDNFLNLRAFRKDLPDLRKLIPGDKDPLGFGVIDTENKVLTFSKIDRKGHIRSARIHCSELGEHPHAPAF